MTGERFFYRVRGLPQDYLNGRVIELIAAIAEPDPHLTRTFLTPEEYDLIRREQDK